jgi:hypothetical protein
MTVGLRRPRRPGFVLATALVISVVMLVVGLGYLGFTGNDYVFAGKMHNNTRAFYLAYAGLQYYSVSGMPAADDSGLNILVVDDVQHFCRVEKQGNGDIAFHGEVTDGYGRLLAERVLIAPNGSLSDWYEATR